MRGSVPVPVPWGGVDVSGIRQTVSDAMDAQCRAGKHYCANCDRYVPEATILKAELDHIKERLKFFAERGCLYEKLEEIVGEW